MWYGIGYTCHIWADVDRLQAEPGQLRTPSAQNRPTVGGTRPNLGRCRPTLLGRIRPGLARCPPSLGRTRLNVGPIPARFGTPRQRKLTYFERSLISVPRTPGRDSERASPRTSAFSETTPKIRTPAEIALRGSEASASMPSGSSHGRGASFPRRMSLDGFKSERSERTMGLLAPRPLPSSSTGFEKGGQEAFTGVSGPSEPQTDGLPPPDISLAAGPGPSRGGRRADVKADRSERGLWMWLLVDNGWARCRGGGDQTQPTQHSRGCLPCASQGRSSPSSASSRAASSGRRATWVRRPSRSRSGRAPTAGCPQRRTCAVGSCRRTPSRLEVIHAMLPSSLSLSLLGRY